MKKSRIEIFPLLDELCGGTTKPDSFRPDVWSIRKGMTEYEMEERSFYWLPCAHGGLCVMAVSYTHLDVYKRQSFIWITPYTLYNG